MKFRFNATYFTLAIILFLIEVYIAMFVHDQIIRPLGGDFLVVILLYCLILSFFNLGVVTCATLVLLFAYLIEILQHYKFVEIIGLQHIQWVKVILGTSFSWSDIVAYTAGVAFVIACEWVRKMRFVVN